jgi:hypothetical protein
MSPNRTPATEKRSSRVPLNVADGFIFAASGILFAIGNHGRASIYYLAVIPVSLVAAAVARGPYGCRPPSRGDAA